MSERDLPDLDHKDIEFLEAVRSINESPDDYEETESGEVAANSTSIRLATNLNRSETKYRMGQDPDDYRGLGQSEGGLGLIRIYEPTLENGSFGPKSAELTEKGIKVLGEAKKRVQSPGFAGQAQGEGGASEERVAELESRVDELVQNLADVQESAEAVEETLSRFEDRNSGALDDEYATKIDAVLSALPLHDQALRTVMGVDLDQLGDELTEEELERLRADIRKTLGVAGSTSS